MDTQGTPSVPPDKESPPAGAQEPEKYIRTFAGDMETFKKGNAPDLVPLTAPTLEERPVAAPATPIPVPVSIQNPSIVPKAAPAYIPPAPANAPIKTYSSDFSDRMKEQHASSATVLAAEQDSAPVLVHSSAPQGPSRANVLYSIAGGILLIAGAAGAYIAYSRYQTALAPVVLAPSVQAPIFVDDREQISGTGSALLSAVEKSVARSLTPNNVRLLYIASTTGSVFTALPLSIPSVLIRNVNTEGSMAGVVNAGGSQSPFFKLSVSSYSNTFSGMLAWEKTMPRSLVRLFPPYPVASGSTASTSVPQAMAVAGFSDTTIANHDVRVYHDESGRSVFLYGYWNQVTLVIARDTAAFVEILKRLATSRTQ